MLADNVIPKQRSSLMQGLLVVLSVPHLTSELLVEFIIPEWQNICLIVVMSIHSHYNRHEDCLTLFNLASLKPLTVHKEVKISRFGYAV